MSYSLHDLAEYETAGVPSVLVASEEFVSAAGAQAAALGTVPAVVYVPHPIQSRTDAEIHDLADLFVDRLIAELTTD